MGGGVQTLKRIPRIKFPQRHPKLSDSSSQNRVATSTDEAPRNFFSRSPSNMTPGGKASEQPKRIPVSQDEIEAIMLGGIVSEL